MSEMDYARECYWPDPEDDGPTETVWVTRDGKRIAVEDMTDSHLLDTIRYLRRSAEISLMSSTLAIGTYLDDDPPDGAWLAARAAERDLYDIDADDYALQNCPTFAAMLAESKKRGLTEQ